MNESDIDIILTNETKLIDSLINDNEVYIPRYEIVEKRSTYMGVVFPVM